MREGMGWVTLGTEGICVRLVGLGLQVIQESLVSFFFALLRFIDGETDTSRALCESCSIYLDFFCSRRGGGGKYTFSHFVVQKLLRLQLFLHFIHNCNAFLRVC